MAKTAAERKQEQRLRDKENGLTEISIKVCVQDKNLIDNVEINKILEVYKSSLLASENSI